MNLVLCYDRFYFLGLQNHCGWWLQPQNWKILAFFGRKAMANLNSILNTRDITLPAKVHVVKAMVFWVVMYRYELDHKEGWAPKNWCFWIVVLKKTLEGILDSIEIKPVHPKGNQPWICTVRTGAETEAPILWPLNAKGRLIGKDPDAGKDWEQEEKGAVEDEMVGWHHRLNGQEFEQTPGDSEGQGSLMCCSSWGHKEWDTTYLFIFETQLTDWTTTFLHMWRCKSLGSLKSFLWHAP